MEKFQADFGLSQRPEPTKIDQKKEGKMKLLVLFLTIFASGCATAGVEKYTGNPGAQAAFRAGQFDRAVIDQARLEERAYREGLNGGLPDIHFYGSVRSPNFRGYVNYDPAPYGRYGALDWRTQIRRRPYGW